MATQRKCKNCGQNWPNNLNMTTAQKVAAITDAIAKIAAGQEISKTAKIDHEETIYRLKYMSTDELGALRAAYPEE